MSKKSISLIRSTKSDQKLNIHQTKSQAMQQQLQQSPDSSSVDGQPPQWYLKKCGNNINKLPSWIPTQRQSQPYRFVIERVTGISFPKKSANSYQYLQIVGTFVTRECEIVGKSINYQCEYPVSSQGRYDQEICWFYHSRVQRNSRDIALCLRFSLIEIKDTCIEGQPIFLGISVIWAPFGQDQVKNATTYKQCSQIQLIAGLAQKFTTANITFSYSIQSSLELKSLSKFIPSQTIVSSQDHVSGLQQQYPPEQKNFGIQQQDFVFINLKQCQIHIPDKFQQQAISTIKSLHSSPSFPSAPLSTSVSSSPVQVTHRKITLGYHNEYQLVMPISRNLELLGKQTTGQYTIFMYEALGDGEIVKIPYYQDGIGTATRNRGTSGKLSTIAVSLVYGLGQVEYEVAVFVFSPNFGGGIQEISLAMDTGTGVGIVSNLLPVKSNKSPTIILEYIVQQNMKKQSDNLLDPDNRGSYKRMSTKSPKNIKQSYKVLEQLQRQRLNLQKQREQLQVLRTQHVVNFQQDFQKKLIEQKEMLRKKQEMIQNQYRQQVQKQIRAKIQLQNQIRLMKQKLAYIQQGQKSQIPSRKVSYDQSPAELDPSTVSIGQQFLNNFIPNARQKVNPNYLLQQQKTIPISQIRDILSKTIQTPAQLLEKQMLQFNFATKFTLNLNSILWSPQINPPKCLSLIIKFFNFGQFPCDPLTYIPSSSPSSHSQLIRLNSYLHSHQSATPSYSFLIDPSHHSNPPLIQQDLVRYMEKNAIIVDIFDADNYIYIGQINMRINQLFRGGRTQTMIAKEYNIVRMRGEDHYGVMQVLIKNQMADCQNQVDMGEKRVKREIKKKVISNNPILIPKQMHQNQAIMSISQVGAKNQTKNRQQKRIQMFKKKALQSKRVRNFDELQNKQKGVFIEKINEYKQKKMPQLIKKIYQQLLTETITINPYFGQSKLFIYQFTNMSHNPSSFRVSFQGNEGELILVKDPTQWKYHVTKNQFAPPKIYDCINNQNSFYLPPGQTIPLLFKYLSFSPSQPSSLSVSIFKQQTCTLTSGFTLLVHPHQTITNHSYTYPCRYRSLYQPGNQPINIILPVIYSTNSITTMSRMQKRLYVTVEECTVEWLNQYEILLGITMPPIMSRIRFNILLYQDGYFCQLRENWFVQLYAYEGVYAVSRADEKTKFKISVPEAVIEEMRPLRLGFYASHADLVFQDEWIEGARLARGSVEVWCQIFPGRISNGSIQITCVNQRKQLVYGWIVQVYPYSPKMA